MEIQQRGSDNRSQGTTPKTGLAFETYTVIKGHDGSPKADNEVKLGLHLFKYPQDLLFRILTEGGALKDFRLVCREAAQLTINFWVLSRCCVILQPINLDTEETLNALLSQPESQIQINEHKLKFISENKLEFELSLSCRLDLNIFHSLLLSQMEETAFIQKMLRITALAVAYLDEEEVKIFKEILKEINKHPNTFINLTSLQTTDLSDFTDFSIPNSIEYFESCPSLNAHEFDTNNVNICNLTNLKSIKLDFMKSCTIANLPKLESITIDELLFCEININRKECPNLASIIVCEEERLFDASVPTIIIKASELLFLDSLPSLVGNALAHFVVGAIDPNDDGTSELSGSSAEEDDVPCTII